MKNFRIGEIVFWSRGLINGFGIVSEILENYKIIPESNDGTCYKVIHVYESGTVADFHYENSLKSIFQLDFKPNRLLKEKLMEVQTSLVNL